MPQRFTPTVFLLTGSLLIWLTTFVLGYGFAAVACARRFADAQVAGVSLVPLVLGTLHLLAAVATVYLLLLVRQRWRGEQQAFLRFVMLACGGVALLALWLLVLPTLLVERSC